MNLAYNYPIIFWDTANLIVDSGSLNLEEKLNEEEEEELIEEENEEENEESSEEEKDTKKKKIKNSSTDYGKIAAAIGKMKKRGLSFSLPDINNSDLTYSPDIKNNTILYGLRGITRIGNDLIKTIISNRPYNSLEDFLSKVKVNKVQMINLIKAGTFDNLYENSREEIMDMYIKSIADQKKRITLQNMQMLIAKDMIPEELDFERKLFNFNKYIKKNKDDNFYYIDDIAINFIRQNYSDNLLCNIELKDGIESAALGMKEWKNIYDKGMNPVRKWMKDNQNEILNNLNHRLYLDAAEKYTEGNISSWEMDSLSFYYHEHELAKLHKEVYDITYYSDLKGSPEVEYTFRTKTGKEIPMFKISRIAGTVIDKNKNKGQVTLLTNDNNVVIVKIPKNQFTVWDRQISQKDSNGTKHVIEKSWFTRGNKLIITGIRREDTFVPKKYKNTTYPLFEKINSIDEKGFILDSVTERVEVE